MIRYIVRMDLVANFDTDYNDLNCDTNDDEEPLECEKHKWEFKKQFKECLICNKCENYLDDPLETHVHKWIDNFIQDKPKLSVCTKCGETKYNFNCEDQGDEGFFQFTSNIVVDLKSSSSTTGNVAKLSNFKNRLPKTVLSKESVNLSQNIPVKPVGKRYTEWKSKNPDKLSFIRK